MKKIYPSATSEYRRAYRRLNKARFALTRKPLVGEAKERNKAYMRAYYYKVKGTPQYLMRKAARCKAQLKHYYKNKEKLLARSKEKRNKLRIIVDKAKSEPCMDCGVSYPPYVMDFDHVRGKKSFQIGGNLHYSPERVLQEIAKCDAVCSNCPRIRTFSREPGMPGDMVPFR